MSKGDWLRNYAVGLIAGLIIAFGVGSQFWMPANQLDTAIQRQASENASEQSQRGEIAVREECAAVLSPAEQRDCIAKETQPYREAERNERDLEAQQVMANWTRVMGKAAIIGMGVGIIGLFLIFTTFWETRKTAQAGFQANKIAEDTAKNQLRAYIEPEIVDWDIDGDRHLSRVVFKNFGATPARSIQVSSCMTIVDAGSVPTFSALEPYLEAAGDIAGQATHTVFVGQDLPPIPNLPEKIATGQKSAFVEVLLAYEDIFGIARETRLRRQAAVYGGKIMLTITREGNRST